MRQKKNNKYFNSTAQWPICKLSLTITTLQHFHKHKDPGLCDQSLLLKRGLKKLGLGGIWKHLKQVVVAGLAIVFAKQHL